MKNAASKTNKTNETNKGFHVTVRVLEESISSLQTGRCLRAHGWVPQDEREGH